MRNHAAPFLDQAARTQDPLARIVQFAQSFARWHKTRGGTASANLIYRMLYIVCNGSEQTVLPTPPIGAPPKNDDNNNNNNVAELEARLREANTTIERMKQEAADASQTARQQIDAAAQRITAAQEETEQQRRIAQRYAAFLVDAAKLLGMLREAVNRIEGPALAPRTVASCDSTAVGAIVRELREQAGGQNGTQALRALVGDARTKWQQWNVPIEDAIALISEERARATGTTMVVEDVGQQQAYAYRYNDNNNASLDLGRKRARVTTTTTAPGFQNAGGFFGAYRPGAAVVGRY